jgi:hypothetical protein
MVLSYFGHNCHTSTTLSMTAEKLALIKNFAYLIYKVIFL